MREQSEVQGGEEIEYRSNSGAPYNISFKKLWKPVMMIYLDLLLAMTFVFVSVCYFWFKMPNNLRIEKWWEIHDFYNFVPYTVSIFWLVFWAKILICVGFLKAFFGKDKANRSSVTSDLFWFRGIYDFIVIGGVLIIVTWVLDNKKNVNEVMSTSFKIYVIVIPKILMELVIYWKCNLPGCQRAIYQKFVKEKDEWPRKTKEPRHD